MFLSLLNPYFYILFILDFIVIGIIMKTHSNSIYQ